MKMVLAHYTLHASPQKFLIYSEKGIYWINVHDSSARFRLYIHHILMKRIFNE